MATPNTTVTTLEDGLLAPLKSEAANKTRVESFPNDPETYRLAGESALLVILQDENYDTVKDQGAGLLSVMREPQFNIVAVAKRRRTEDRRQGQQTAYNLIETVLGALSGEEVGNYHVIPGRADSLGLNPRDKSWRYQLTIRLLPNEVLDIA